MKNGMLRTMISLFSIGVLLSSMPAASVNATELNMATNKMAAESVLQSTEVLTESGENLHLTSSEEQVNVAEGLNNYDSFVSARNYAAKLSQLDNEPIVVAVVDSGIDKSHAMFSGRVITGYDYVDNDSNPADTHGHGTNVASVIVDCTQGMGSKIRIMPVRVLNDNNQGAASWIANGIRYAADHGAKVICLALGGEHNDVKESAIHYAIEKGALVVVSAGSSGYDLDVNKYCPAHMGSEAGVIAASALGKDGKLAYFSNFGTSVDLVAMGEDVKVAKLGGGYATTRGTNIPTAVVSAIAAELFYEHPDYTPQQVETMLLNNAVDLGAAGRDTQYGMGKVSADAFYNKYTVAFSADGATNVPDPITVVEGEIVEIPSIIPVKWASFFKNWRYTYRSGSRLMLATYQPGDKIKVAKNMTLTADWHQPTVIDNTFPKNYSAEILVAGSHLWFEFTPEETGKYVFHSSESWLTDTRAALYKEDQTLLKEDDDSGDGRAFLISEILQAGQKYYLETNLYSTSSIGGFTLTVDRVPYIIKQPQSQTVVEGKQVNFQVAANGAGLTYQWQYSQDNGITWKNSGAASGVTPTYVLGATASRNGYLIRCIVKDANGKSVTSDAVKLTVTAAGPVITTQPKAVTAVEGTNATFKVVATGTGLTYQWQYSQDNGTTWKNSSAASAVTDTYVLGAKESRNGYLIRCIVKDANGKSATSSAVKLTVTAAGPVITTQPKAVTAEEGTNATFKVVATGTGLTYQWQYSQDNGSTWKNSSAASSVTDTYVLGAKASRNGYLIRCIVKDANGKSVTSNAVKLTVTAAGPVITTQPKAVTAVEGTNATFKVVATGTGLTYQWQYSQDNGTTWKNSSAASSVTDTYVLGAKESRNGYLIRCIVKDANGKSATSNAVKLTVTAAGPAITTQPKAVTAVEGTNATFKIVATGTGLTYQWQYSQDNGTTWKNSSAASSVTDTYVLGAKASRNGYLIRCIVTDANGKTVTSSAVKLTVTAAK